MRPDFQKKYSYFPSIQKPVIAAVNGPAVGLGFIISLYCDLRFASETARFGTAFAKRGLIAEYGLAWMLPRLIGPANALDMLFSARLVDANEALRMGLVNQVYPAGQLYGKRPTRTPRIWRTTSARARCASSREQVYNAMFQTLSEAFETAEHEMVQSLQCEDFKEGVAHFLEKRAAVFTGQGEPSPLMNFDFPTKSNRSRKGCRPSWTSTFIRTSSAIRTNSIRMTAGSPREVIEELKPKARAAGLWNLFLPESEDGAGLTNLEYAPLCEIMGRSTMAPEVFNCSAPDTGNMEVLARYGTPGAKGTLAEAAARGRDPFLLFDDGAGRRVFGCHQHREQHCARWRSLRDQRPQVVVLRRGRSALQDFHLHGQDRPDGAETQAAVHDSGADGHAGRHDRAHAHSVRLRSRSARPRARSRFKNVRVPVSNMLLGEGRGFEIAQGRLGPGRIHHCMRLIGVAERALETMCRRADCSRRVRQEARRAGHHSRGHRRFAHGDRAGALAGAESRLHDGHGRQQSRARARSR